MSVWDWLLELTLIVLLGATLFHALRLERGIAVLRRDRLALTEILASIHSALADAERGVRTLQRAADDIGGGLATNIEAARQAQHDLQFMLDRLENVATKVEGTIRLSRSAGEPAAAPAPSFSKAERDLLKVLRMSK
jgi:prefoldin subunit 5